MLAANSSITVLIGADVRLYSEGISRLLEAEPGIEVLATVASMDQLLALLTELRPDVLLLDSAMPGSVESMPAIRERAADVKIVALGVPEVDGDILRCAEAGVSGYLTSRGTAADLVLAVRSAARGEAVCSPRAAAALMQRLARLAEVGHNHGHGDGLTPRQRQILQLIDGGLSNKEIAARLCIEVPTVKSHVHTILQKVGARRRGEAAALLRGSTAAALNPRV